jgi:hypothetical protein
MIQVIPVGYHNVPNATVKSMVIQDILAFFKRDSRYKNWRCTVARDLLAEPINLDFQNKRFILCPLFLDYVDYSRASYKVHQVLDSLGDGRIFADSDDDGDSLDDWFKGELRVSSKGANSFGKAEHPLHPPSFPKIESIVL